jgi:hypothetical protein
MKCPLCGGEGEPLFTGFACRGARDCKNYVRDTIPTMAIGFSVTQARSLVAQGIAVQFWSTLYERWTTPFPGWEKDHPGPWVKTRWRLKP